MADLNTNWNGEMDIKWKSKAWVTVVSNAIQNLLSSLNHDAKAKGFERSGLAGLKGCSDNTEFGDSFLRNTLDEFEAQQLRLITNTEIFKASIIRRLETLQWESEERENITLIEKKLAMILIVFWSLGRDRMMTINDDRIENWVVCIKEVLQKIEEVFFVEDLSPAIIKCTDLLKNKRLYLNYNKEMHDLWDLINDGKHDNDLNCKLWKDVSKKFKGI